MAPSVAGIGTEPLIDKGRGPVVVLLHALLMDHSLFEHQALELSEQGFRVISPSYAGHGSSDRLVVEPTVEAMADQVFDLLDKLNINEPVILGGLSMGGYVSFAAWKKYEERIRGLMLMDTRAVADTAEEAKNRRRAAQLIKQAGSVGPLVATMIPKLMSKTTVKEKPDVWQRVARTLDGTCVDSASDALHALATRPDRREMLREIHVPTLVIVGEDDQISPPGEMEQIARAIPHSDFYVIEKAGHLSSVECPEAVNWAILQFLKEHF